MPDRYTDERRREPRHAVSLPVWWQGPGRGTEVQHGWLLDISGHGLAMLAPQHCCPAVDERLDLSLVDPGLGQQPEVARYLLKRATVYRLDPLVPSLKRVALRFDQNLWERDNDPFLEELVDIVADRDSASGYPEPRDSSRAGS